MKFTYTGSGLNNYYGYNAKDGDVLDVDRANIIVKMRNHKDFKEKRAKRKKKAD